MQIYLYYICMFYNIYTHILRQFAGENVIHAREHIFLF